MQLDIFKEILVPVVAWACGAFDWIPEQIGFHAYRPPHQLPNSAV